MWSPSSQLGDSCRVDSPTSTTITISRKNTAPLTHHLNCMHAPRPRDNNPKRPLSPHPLTLQQTDSSHGCRNRSHASSSAPRCTLASTSYAAPRPHSYAAASPPGNYPHSCAYVQPGPSTTPPTASPTAPAPRPAQS